MSQPDNAHALQSRLESALGLRLPAFYAQWARQIGLPQADYAPNDWTVLYAWPDLPAMHQAYQVPRWLPGFVLVGSDGGDGGIFLRADGSGDSNIYRCGLGALAEDELAILAPSLTHWLRGGCDSQTPQWDARHLTQQLQDAAWQAARDQAAVRAFLHAELARLDAARQAQALPLKDHLQRKRLLQALLAQAPAQP